MSVSQRREGEAPPGRASLVLERSYTFAASHRYFRPEWTLEKNHAVFGRCANFPAHGHNYRLTVRVSGLLDPETGFVADLPALDSLVKKQVIDRLDHAHVNEALPEFAPGKAIPTSENLAIWIAATIAAALPPANVLEEVRLAEDDRLASIWSKTRS